MNARIWQRVGTGTLVALVLVWCGVLLAQRANLITADLGRHIQNGQILLHGTNAQRSALLHANFYSYTNTDFSFINHHWLSGPLAYGIWLVAGFNGLSLAYILGGMATLWLSFRVAQRGSTVWVALGVTLLLLPLLASRTEVRPEMLTYLFSAYFFYVLWHYQRGLLSQKWLYTLPIVELLWVNLHIGFILGVFIFGVFLTEDYLTRAWRGLSFVRRGADQAVSLSFSKERVGVRWLLGIFACTALTTLLNPNFFAGAIYPFRIFSNFGYRLVENQSIPFLEGLKVGDPLQFLMMKIALVAMGLSFALPLLCNRKAFSLSNAVFAAVFGYLAYNGIRHFPTFAFMAVPILAINIGSIIKLDYWRRQTVITALVVVGSIFGVFWGVRQDALVTAQRWPNTGLGLIPGINMAGEFVKANHIKGPLFNNYDIGGYLIYHLYPEKVFIDNRPEAYPASFFSDSYQPAQEDSNKWAEVSQKYGFKTIIFSVQDYTPWGQQFLLSRIQDPNWAVVYYDGAVIIFVTQSPEHENLIKQFGIPSEAFRVTGAS